MSIGSSAGTFLVHSLDHLGWPAAMVVVCVSVAIVSFFSFLSPLYSFFLFALFPLSVY
jgi:hypothetical protein